jgi:hypothetical protein
VPIAYARRISNHPDDLASQLERLFDDRPEHGLDLPIDAPGHPDDGDAAPSSLEVPRPDELEIVLQAEVDDVEEDGLDELRGQLDDAFNEVENRINRVELRLAALRTAAEAHAAVTVRLDETATTTLERLERLLALVEGAVADLPEDDHVPSAPAAPPAPDTEAIDALAAQLVDDRLHLEAAIDQLRQQVVALRDKPMELDTRRLEEATRQGALHNAADIATLAQDVDALARGLRLQDQRLAEVHATLDWVKQRLLAR